MCGRGESYYDALAFARIGAAWRYYLYDGLGATRQLLDGSQNVTDTYQYEAFGNLMSSTGTTPNPYRYVGSLGYYQTGTSLQHLGARYYEPSLGRFLSPDPLRAASAEEGHRSYPYSDSNPVMRVDPDGKQWIEILKVVYMIVQGQKVVKLRHTSRKAASLAELCKVCNEDDCVEKLENRTSGFGVCEKVTTPRVSRKGCEETWETKTVTAVCKIDKRSGRMQTLWEGKYVDCLPSSRLGIRPPGMTDGPLD